MERKHAAPAMAVMVGGGAGTSVGTLIEIVAAAAGKPLPPGTGSAITGVIGMLVAYFAPGGRKGDPR